MRGSQCQITTQRFARGWKDEAKCASGGIRPGTYFSGDPFCGSTRRCGIGSGGKEGGGSMRIWLAVALWGTGLLIAGCDEGKTTVSSVTNAAAVPAPAPITPAKPATADVPDNVLVVSGPIIVEHQVDVTAQRDGVLAKIFFDAPTRVKAGTVLAQMDDRQIEANLEASRAKSRSIEDDLKNWQAEAEVLKADYVRQQHLWQLGLTSEEQLQHAKYKAESDQWDIQRVKETLNTSH